MQNDFANLENEYNNNNPKMDTLDKTEYINKLIEKQKYLINENKNLKFGLEKCSCELVAIHSDYDIALPNRFEKQIAYFNSHDVDILGGQILEINNKTNKSFGLRKVPLSDREIKAYIKTRSPFNHPTVMFKRDKIKYEQCKNHNIRIIYYAKEIHKNYELGKVYNSIDDVLKEILSNTTL